MRLNSAPPFRRKSIVVFTNTGGIYPKYGRAKTFYNNYLKLPDDIIKIYNKR